MSERERERGSPVNWNELRGEWEVAADDDWVNITVNLDSEQWFDEEGKVIGRGIFTIFSFYLSSLSFRSS